jgi:hypothetical protein
VRDKGEGKEGGRNKINAIRRKEMNKLRYM